jgi:hypothetical protein
MRLSTLFIGIVALMVVAVMPLHIALAQEANPTRALPDTVGRGETFNVTVTFTAPADKFNAIGLTDLAPDGWNVTIDKMWCTPNADAVEATDNKAEIAWFGEPGVGFDKYTSFSVVYKVTVPDYAPAGIYIFNGFLEYYLAAEGPYHENITGDSEVEVTLATLEGHASFLRREAAPDPTWETPIVVRFFDNATTLEMGWSPLNATTNNTGVFSITGLDPGTYDIAIKNWTCLSELVVGVTLSDGETTVVDFGVIREGDVNNDDKCNIIDLSALGDAFGTIKGDPGYNEHADFNRDDKVNILDLSILGGNFGLSGDLETY